MQTIGLLPHQNKAEALDATGTLIEILAGAGVTVRLDAEARQFDGIRASMHASRRTVPCKRCRKCHLCVHAGSPRYETRQ